MFALFDKCEEVIARAMEEHGGGDSGVAWLRNEGAAWFREKMISGQTVRFQGEYRKAFYDDVIKRAERVIFSRHSHPPRSVLRHIS